MQIFIQISIAELLQIHEPWNARRHWDQSLDSVRHIIMPRDGGWRARVGFHGYVQFGRPSFLSEPVLLYNLFRFQNLNSTQVLSSERCVAIKSRAASSLDLPRPRYPYSLSSKNCRCIINSSAAVAILLFREWIPARWRKRPGLIDNVDNVVPCSLSHFPIISDGKVNCSQATLQHVQLNGPAHPLSLAALEILLVWCELMSITLNGNGMFDTSWGGIIGQLKWISFIL